MRLHNHLNRRTILLSLVIGATSAAPHAAAVDLVGYIPYYRMNSTYNSTTLPKHLAMLDEIRYFGLTAGSDGSIQAQSGSGTVDGHKNNIAIIKAKIDAMPIEHRPRLNITLGGAGEDATFTSIASGGCSLCTTFAQNVKSLLDSTGATSVDVDWEHPNAGVERSTTYPDMLKRIKQQVGAERRVYATVDPTVMISNSVLSGANAIDGISLMTYDLGWWGNDPSNPFQGEHSLPQYVTNSVDAWTEPLGSPNDRPWVFGTWGNNVPNAKLGVGLPFYAHTLTEPDLVRTYSELVASGTTSDGNYFTLSGRSYWIPGPSLAEQRVQTAIDRGLQHVIIWELGQDLPVDNPYSLLYRAYTKKLGLAVAGDYDADLDVDAADYAKWRSMFGQTGFGKAADGTGNQAVDAADYVLWRMNASGAGSGTSLSLAVPEPSAACMLTMLLLVHSLSRSRKSQ